MQSVAGFASLHCAITLLVALMVQFTLRSRVLQWVFWVNFGVTVVATLYFGWHYIADDVAGILIALISFYVGGIASGQKFDRHGLASHPTTTDLRRPRRAGLTDPADPPLSTRCPAETPPGRRLRRPVAGLRVRELQPCSSSRRHAGDSKKKLRKMFLL